MATPIPVNRAHFSVEEIARATRGAVVVRGSREIVSSVTTDSRAVSEGSAFVALRGASFDGHTFVGGAIAKGAAAVVVERSAASVVKDAIADLRKSAEPSCSIVEVDDTLVAWADLAHAHIEKWRAKDARRRVVAITGSAGKTTTKEITAALLAVVGPTHFTAGNLNNRIGMPAVVFGLEEHHRFAVLEMGMSLPGEIDAMAKAARPDVAIVTNVLVAHAEGVGGREGVMHEKGGVYRALGERGVAIVNADDAFATRASELAGVRHALRFGRAEGASYRLVDRQALGALGSRVELSISEGDTDRALAIHLQLPGEAAAIDLAAALAATEAASGEHLEAGAIDRALSGLRLEGRATVKLLAKNTVVLDDTYNANPGSMRAALATLAEIAEGRRRVAILGEMKELGALAEEEHAALGDAIADAKVALAIGCGGLISLALERAALRGVEVIAAVSTSAAAQEASVRVAPGDAILVKGSRSVGAERVVAALSEVLPPSSKSASSSSGFDDVASPGRTE